MSVEVPTVEEKPRSWELQGTELPNGFLARFIGHDVTSDEQVNEIRHRVRSLLEGAGVDEETCDNAELITSELAANGIEHSVAHRITELDVTVAYPSEGGNAEVYLSVINPTSEETVINSDPSMTDEENQDAESGRGGIITAALTEGDWGWSVAQLRPEQDAPLTEKPSLIVYAHLGATGLRKAA